MVTGQTEKSQKLQLAVLASIEPYSCLLKYFLVEIRESGVGTVKIMPFEGSQPSDGILDSLGMAAVELVDFLEPIYAFELYISLVAGGRITFSHFPSGERVLQCALLITEPNLP
jgi:hypothetical protein